MEAMDRGTANKNHLDHKKGTTLKPLIASSLGVGLSPQAAVVVGNMANIANMANRG